MNNPELCFKIFTYFIETQALKTLFKIEFFFASYQITGCFSAQTNVQLMIYTNNEKGQGTRSFTCSPRKVNCSHSWKISWSQDYAGMAIQQREVEILVQCLLNTSLLKKIQICFILSSLYRISSARLNFWLPIWYRIRFFLSKMTPFETIY